MFVVINTNFNKRFMHDATNPFVVTWDSTINNRKAPFFNHERVRYKSREDAQSKANKLNIKHKVIAGVDITRYIKNIENFLTIL